MSNQSFGQWFEDFKKRSDDPGEEESLPLVNSNNNNNNDNNNSGEGSNILSSAGATAAAQKGWGMLKNASSLMKAKVTGQSSDLENQSTAPSSSSSDSNLLSIPSISRSERFKGFVGLLGLSMFFFIMASFSLSVIVLFPGKFAMSFTMGSACFMGAFALIQGPWKWLKSVCTLDRLPFTLSYFGSMAGTIYACMGLRSYILTLSMSLVQMVALAWYGSSYVPGGRAGMRMVFSMLTKMIKMAFLPCLKMWGKLCGCRG